MIKLSRTYSEMNDQTIENLYSNEWSNYRDLIQNWMIKL